MKSLYNLDGPKTATNLSLNRDLLKKSRVLNIKLSARLEKALKEKLAESQTEKWHEENKSAIRDLTTRIVIPLGKLSHFKNESTQGLTPQIASMPETKNPTLDKTTASSPSTF